MALKRVKPPAKKPTPVPKRAPGRKLKGMTDKEKRMYAISKFNTKRQKKNYEAVKKDSFGFTVRKGRKTDPRGARIVTDQKI